MRNECGSACRRRDDSGGCSLCRVLLRLAADDAANYPNRPVRLLAASAAGGNPDVIARLLSAKLSEAFNNPFVVEDVPGVGGVLAANQTVAKRRRTATRCSLNDTGALAINVAMNPDVKYTLKDFTPITALASLPTVLVVKPAVAGQHARRIRGAGQDPSPTG